jgi:hypothetical protein
MIRPLELLTLGLVWSSAPLFAQQLVWDRVGVANQYTFGQTSVSANGLMANLGDLSGDGCDDLAVIVENLLAAQRGSEIWILSGIDGTTIRAVPRVGVQEIYAQIAAAGDVDGDGVRDYVTTVIDVSPSGNTTTIVEVRSGTDDRVLWQLERPRNENLGAGLAGDLDLDGDDWPDLAVTVPNLENQRTGSVFAYSHDGRLLWKQVGTLTQPVGWIPGWQALANAGDVDGDGRDDLVTSGYDIARNAGLALVLSGRTGEILVSGSGPANGPVIGEAVAGLGDVDGDGVPDFAAGVAYASLLMAFSGRTGAVLHTWTSAPPIVSLGTGITSGLDVDQDGIPDLIAGAPGPQSFVLAFSGRDGAELLRQVGPTSMFQTRFGNTVAALRPQPGSSFGLLVACSQAYGPYVGASSYLGRLQAFRVALPGVQSRGAPCEGTLGIEPRIGLRSLGAAGTRVHLSNTPPGSPALLLLGVGSTWQGSPLPVSLQPYGFRICSLRAAPEIVLATTTGTGDGVARGYAAIDLPLPLATGTAQLTVSGQWLVLGSGETWPGALSGALAWSH